jgi:hypothetical protein
MLSVTQLLCLPLVSVKRRFGGRLKAASLDAPPPPIEIPNEWKFGPYSWKATVEARDSKGEVDRTFIGYSQNMNITTRTEAACDRHKSPGTTCGEPELTMKGGECDEVIFLKMKGNDTLINLSRPYF